MPMFDISRDAEANEEEYEPVIAAVERKIFCYKVQPVQWAWFKFISAFVEIASVFAGSSKSPLLRRLMLIYAGVFMVLSWVAVPIYQNLTIVNKELKQTPPCWSCWTLNLFRVCTCRNSFMCRKDDLQRKVTRFVPFSIYNYWFMMMHPGKELNPMLPKDIDRFGGMRAYLLFQQCAALGGLKLILFLSAALQFKNAGIGIEYLTDWAFGFFTFFGAMLSLQNTFIALGFQLAGLPYFLVLIFWGVSCVLPCCNALADPKNNTCQYNVFLYYWNKCAWL